jgi:hypothetical protein
VRLLLLAILVFLAATVVARRVVRAEVAPLSAGVIAAVAPPAPAIDRYIEAIRSRRWALAVSIESDLPAQVAGVLPESLVKLRDDCRRGAQRDATGVIESKILVGPLAALGPADTQRVSLKQLSAEAPYTPPPARLNDLLIFTPRGLKPEAVQVLVEELRLLRIAGLELTVSGREVATPLPGLAGAGLRYLGGPAIDRVPPAVFAACDQLEILDLQACQQNLGPILSAVAGRTTLRVLKLPTARSPEAAGMAALGTLSGVEELELGCAGLDDAAIAHLGGLAALRRLRLVIDRATPVLAEALVTGSPQLEDLSCSAAGLTGAAVFRLAALANLRALRVENDLTAEAFAALGSLSHLSKLSCSIAEVIDLAPLSTLQHLADLSLCVGSPPQSADAVAGLGGVHATRLFLQCVGVDDRFAAAVQRMPQLERLELSSTAVSDAGVEQMALSQELRAIEINANSVITGSCLPTLLRSSSLHELRLASNRIPEAVVLACPDPGRLERFTWAGAAPSPALLAHLIAWPGMVQVTCSGKIDKDVRKRLQEANERRSSVPPDLPGPAFGF